MSNFRNEPHWTRDSSGEWAVCIPGRKINIGTYINVSKADGSSSSVIITDYVEKGSYGHLYKAADNVNMVEPGGNSGAKYFWILATISLSLGIFLSGWLSGLFYVLFAVFVISGFITLKIDSDNQCNHKSFFVSLAFMCLCFVAFFGWLAFVFTSTAWIVASIAIAVIFGLAGLIVLGISAQEKSESEENENELESELVKISENAELSLLNKVLAGDYEDKEIKVIDGIAHIVLSEELSIPLTNDTVDSYIVLEDDVNFNITLNFNDDKLSMLIIDSETLAALKDHCKSEL